MFLKHIQKSSWVKLGHLNFNLGKYIIQEAFQVIRIYLLLTPSASFGLKPIPPHFDVTPPQSFLRICSPQALLGNCIDDFCPENEWNPLYPLEVRKL